MDKNQTDLMSEEEMVEAADRLEVVVSYFFKGLEKWIELLGLKNLEEVKQVNKEFLEYGKTIPNKNYRVIFYMLGIKLFHDALSQWAEEELDAIKIFAKQIMELFGPEAMGYWGFIKSLIKATQLKMEELQNMENGLNA